jgi:hypothetical protein
LGPEAPQEYHGSISATAYMVWENAALNEDWSKIYDNHTSGDS